jgi:1,4-dihydroxy-2-naphthoate polyprenyltransferase
VYLITILLTFRGVAVSLIRDLVCIVRLGRFHFVIAGFLLFSCGSLFAALNGGELSPPRFLMAYAILFTVHLSVSYSNDYFDVEVDRHTIPTLFSGGSGVLITHPHLRSFSKIFALILIGISYTVAVISILYSLVPASIILFLILGTFLGWFYTAPPLRLAYHGLGEVAMTITMGFIVPGMGYIAARGTYDIAFLLFSLPLFMYGIVFIMNVEIPDADGDRRGGKLTLIARRGERYGFATIALSALAATVLYLALSVVPVLPHEIDPRIVALFSLAPTIAGFFGVRRSFISRAMAIRYVYVNLFSLIGFIVLMDWYLFALVSLP